MSSRPQTQRPLLALLALLATAMAPVSIADAQLLARLANPSIDVMIEHPPELNIQVDTIVFGQAVGNCADEVTQALIDDFLHSGLDVVDRDHLNAILKEHNLAARGLSDPSTILAVGEIVGPSALISVRATRCAPKRETSERKTTKYETRTTTTKDEDGNETTETTPVPAGTVTTRVAQTSVDMRVSIRVVDLTTGRVFGGRSFATSPALENSLDLENSWDDSKPSYPPESAVMDLAVGSVLADVRPMFFGWTESRQVVFYNNDRCGLKLAYRTLRNGEHDRVLELSRRNLEACLQDRKAKKRVLANAYYNLGMAQTIVGDYDEALGNLTKAERLRPGSVVNEAIAETRAAQEASAARDRFNEETQSLAEAKESFLAEQTEAEQKALEAEAAAALTNDDIVGMVEAGLADSIIVARIRNATTEFSLGTTDLKALTEVGVSEEVVVTMISSGDGR